MNPQIEILRKTRANVLEQIKDLTNEQLNYVAEGFNNNIIWNLEHMIATQQGMSYRRAGLPTIITDDFWEKYRTGSKPDGLAGENEALQIRELLFTTLDKFEIDYDKKIFGNYTAWSTRSGVEIASIDDSLRFLPYHEGLHSGTI